VSSLMGSVIAKRVLCPTGYGKERERERAAQHEKNRNLPSFGQHIRNLPRG
jgi:hypothetical protein